MGKKRQIESFADAKVQAGMTDDAMFQTIKNGKKDGDGKNTDAGGRERHRRRHQGVGKGGAEFQTVETRPGV